MSPSLRVTATFSAFLLSLSVMSSASADSHDENQSSDSRQEKIDRALEAVRKYDERTSEIEYTDQDRTPDRLPVTEEELEREKLEREELAAKIAQAEGFGGVYDESQPSPPTPSRALTQDDLDRLRREREAVREGLELKYAQKTKKPPKPVDRTKFMVGGWVSPGIVNPRGNYFKTKITGLNIFPQICKIRGP